MTKPVSRLASQYMGPFAIREHDACGVGLAGYTDNRDADYNLIAQGLDLLWQMRHRAGINPNGLSDGLGLMMDLSSQSRFANFAENEFNLTVNNPNLLAVANVMLPQNNPEVSAQAKQLIEDTASNNGQRVLGWRRVPTNYEVLGAGANDAPEFWHFMTESAKPDEAHFQQEARVQQMAHRINGLAWQTGLNDGDHPHQVYVANFSTQRLLYKAMAPHGQFADLFTDLKPNSELGLTAKMVSLHARYSTNTGSIHPLAQGFSSVMHNGEINTIAANARRLLEKAGPNYLVPGLSDSAILDMAYSYMVYEQQLPPDAAVAALIQPLSRFHNAENKLMAARQLRTLMQGGAYNGPANLVIQAPRGELGDEVLMVADNNGMRPSNLMQFDNGLFIYGSEVIVPAGLAAEQITLRNVMGKGGMNKFDVSTGALTSADETFAQAMEKVAALTQIGPQVFYSFPAAPANQNNAVTNGDLIAMGYHAEYLQRLLIPMAVNSKEPIDAMGRAAPIAAFRKTFASPYEWLIHQHVQVTAPTLASDIETADFTNYVTLPDDINLRSAMVMNEEAAALKITTQSSQHIIDASYDLQDGRDDPEFLENYIDRLADEAALAAENGKAHIWISHRQAGSGRVAIPSLFIIGAVQQALLQKGLRHKVGIYAEVGDIGEPHSCSMAIAAGADVINPYMTLDLLKREADNGHITKLIDGEIHKISWEDARKNYHKAVDGPVSALMKIRSKMGAPDIGSYTGSNFFAAIGISDRIMQKYFPGTESRIDGVGLDHFDRQARGLREIGDRAPDQAMPQFGIYRDHSMGQERDVIAEPHYPPNGWPQAIQAAIAKGHQNDAAGYETYKAVITETSDWPVNPRDLLEVNSRRKPLRNYQVMSEDEIIRSLFKFGHASFGSLSWKFKRDMAIAASMLGITSGSGEGGIPNVDGHVTDEDVQIASARFGVDVHALANAKHITIKISQGAKPGIGGELPGIKVQGLVAETRNVVDGTTLISPPNHFGLHSIEDLALLIRVLKKVSNVEVTVKITSGVGVEAVAAGVAKGGADIHLSGFNGGTGASPISATHHSGYPWELSAATTLAYLTQKGLDQIADLTIDGSIYAPKDAFVAVLMGAGKVGLMTLPMIFAGCDKQDDCHSGNCDKGIATNNENVMKKYNGTPEDIVLGTRYFARQFREMMTEHGFCNLHEMRGHTEYLQQIKTGDTVLDSFDLRRILPVMPERPSYAENLSRNYIAPNFPTENEDLVMEEFVNICEKDIGKLVIKGLILDNADIGFLTSLSGEMARRQKQYPDHPLPKVEIHSAGIAGEYAGFALHPNITWHHQGFMNDGAAEANSGGLLVVSKTENLDPHSDLLGNSSSYGQTKGIILNGGGSGTRTAPRFSGGLFVAEGVGDNSFQFTTGGMAVVAGNVGHNFGAGSHGGILTVINDDPEKTIGHTAQSTLTVYGSDGRVYNGKDDNGPTIDGENLNLLLEIVKFSLAAHSKLTNSDRSEEILKNWDEIIRGNSAEKLLLMLPHQGQAPTAMKKVTGSVLANMNQHQLLPQIS